jgi:hypothetical protein
MPQSRPLATPRFRQEPARKNQADWGDRRALTGPRRTKAALGYTRTWKYKVCS